MDLINRALEADINGPYIQLQLIGLFFLLLAMGAGLSKLLKNDSILAGTFLITMALAFTLAPYIITTNNNTMELAIKAIEKSGPDPAVMTEIKSYLDGAAVPVDSWYLRNIECDACVYDTQKTILMTYASVFEEKTGKLWDRELVSWNVYFEKVVKPLLQSRCLRVKK